VSWTVFPDPQNPEPAAQVSNPLLSDKLLDAKVRLHRRLIEEINLSALEKLPEDEMRGHVKQLVTQYILVERLALNQQELDDFVAEILDEMTGLGPLEPLLKDGSISDILINGHECVYVERGGLLEPCGVRFKDEAHLLRIINKIVSAVGRRVDESHPLCDARLLDGSRVNVAVRPVGVDGPLVSIRKFSKKPFNLNKLVEYNAIKPADGRSAGCGGAAPHHHHHFRRHRLRQDHDAQRALRLHLGEGAPDHHRGRRRAASCSSRMWRAWRRGRPTSKARARIRQRELVKNALRMRPERIILGECRGEEAFDMLQAMNTGHEGSMATITPTIRARRSRVSSSSSAWPACR
jgi:pilus assembly protein CpaF